MPSPAHILETALLILVAFLVGCVIGYVARRLTLPKAVATAAEPAKPAAPEGPQLVVAPVIAPIARPGPDVAERFAAAAAGAGAKLTAENPAPASAAEPAPAPSLPPELVAALAEVRDDALPAEPAAALPAPEPAALVAPAVEPEPPPAPVVVADVPSIDEGLHVLDPVSPRPEPQQPIEAPVAPADPLPEASVQMVEAREPPPEASATEPDDRLVVPAPEVAQAEEIAAAVPPSDEPSPLSEPPSRQAPASRTALEEDAEAAAMRAIEGGWTPRVAVAPAQPAPEPELSRAEIEAAMQSARQAVASAAAAAQAALAEQAAPEPDLVFETAGSGREQSFLEPAAPAPATPEPGLVAPDQDLPFEPGRPIGGFGRPPALPEPRPEGRDNLTRIPGVTTEIESALNRLGIFHYDQVAAWDQKATVWLDQHLTLRGRIGRDKWVEQARALSRGRQPARAVRR